VTLNTYKPNFFNFFCVFLFFIFFSCYLTSPIITYGFQIIGLGVLGGLVFIRTGFSIYVVNSIYFIAFSFLMVLISLIQSFYLIHQDILWLQVFRILFWCFICYISCPFLVRVNVIDYERALKSTILILSIALIYQSCSFFLFGYFIDYSSLIGGVPSRIYFNDVFRPSGLTSEPAIHSGVMIGLLTLLFILNKNCRPYFMLGLVSIFLSMSVLGILMGVCFIVLVLLADKKIKALPLIILFVLVVLFLTGDILLARYDTFLSGGDSSNATKIVSFTNMLENDALLYLGYGFNGSTENTPWFYEGLYDVTAYGSFIIAFGIPIGILVLLFFLMMISRLNFSFTEKALVCLVFVKITLPILCFFVFFVVVVLIFSKRKVYSNVIS